MKKAGFTLLELLIVMGIMIILSVIALVGYRGVISGSGVVSACSHLGQICQLSRQMALIQGKSVFVIFYQDATSSWYTVCRKEGEATMGTSGNTLNDEFNSELGFLRPGIDVFNLSTTGALYSTIRGIPDNGTSVTTSNSIWNVGDMYGWEVRPRMRLPALFRFDSAPLTIRFRPDGTACSWDGIPPDGGQFDITIREATRTDNPAVVTIQYMGFVKYSY